MENNHLSILINCYASNAPNVFVELKQLVDCFADVFTSKELLERITGLSKDHIDYLFKEYSWEILDKICDFALTMSSSSPVMEYMFQMLSVIAGELYLLLSFLILFKGSSCKNFKREHKH